MCLQKSFSAGNGDLSCRFGGLRNVAARAYLRVGRRPAGFKSNDANHITMATITVILFVFS
jgi:hypothetical protein